MKDVIREAKDGPEYVYVLASNAARLRANLKTEWPPSGRPLKPQMPHKRRIAAAPASPTKTAFRRSSHGLKRPASAAPQRRSTKTALA